MFFEGCAALTDSECLVLDPRALIARQPCAVGAPGDVICEDIRHGVLHNVLSYSCSNQLPQRRISFPCCIASGTGIIFSIERRTRFILMNADTLHAYLRCNPPCTISLPCSLSCCC